MNTVSILHTSDIPCGCARLNVPVVAMQAFQTRLREDLERTEAMFGELDRQTEEAGYKTDIHTYTHT